LFLLSETKNVARNVSIKINKYCMKILEIICETVIVIDENRSTDIPFIDGTIWVGDHFLQRSSARGGTNAVKRAIGLVAKFNQTQLKNEIAAIPPENQETFLLYDPTYFGVSVIKQFATLPNRKKTVAYVLKTVSDTLYPKERQKLYMIDENPRKFNHNDYKNFPLDVKRYILQTWNNTGFSKKDIAQIKQDLTASGIKI
jgi:hypothetical protein